MTVPTSTMLDTTGANYANIPASTHYVAGYVSGLDDVPWPVSAWNRFPTNRKVRIWQGAGDRPPASGFDVIDVESGAVTPAQAAQAIADRVNINVPWTTVYGTDSTLAQVTEETRKLGDRIWIGHVDYWLANWDLDEIEAAAILGTEVHGATVVGVQWASPRSNPNTIVPGGTQNLRETNIDISVVNANWVPSGGFGPPPSPTPPPKTYNGLLVVTDANGIFHARAVTSHDDVNWK